MKWPRCTTVEGGCDNDEDVTIRARIARIASLDVIGGRNL